MKSLLSKIKPPLVGTKWQGRTYEPNYIYEVFHIEGDIVMFGVEAAGGPKITFSSYIIDFLNMYKQV